MPLRTGSRRSNAAAPAGRINPSFVSSSTRFVLMLLQMLPGRRGEKRIMYADSPSPRRRPSIHPKHSASSTDCGHVIDGLPVCTLWKPTQSSAALAWFFSSHSRNFAGVAK